MTNSYHNIMKKTLSDLCKNASDFDLKQFEDVILNEKNKRARLKR